MQLLWWQAIQNQPAEFFELSHPIFTLQQARELVLGFLKLSPRLLAKYQLVLIGVPFQHQYEL